MIKMNKRLKIKIATSTLQHFYDPLVDYVTCSRANKTIHIAKSASMPLCIDTACTKLMFK